MWARKVLGHVYDRLPCKQPLLSMVRPLGIPHSIYKHLHFSGQFEVATPRGPFQMVHYGDEIENELFWEGLPGRRERVSMGLWMKLCLEPQVIVDIGANTGIYSLVAAAMNPASRIFGFEPLPRLFARYERNCRLNNFDVRACRIALSNGIGIGVMHGWVLETHSREPDVDREFVPISRLDTIIDTHGVRRVDLMKIDVEGHEPQVLEGMGVFLKKFKPTLLVEVLSDAAGARLEELLGDLGYLYFDIDEVGPPRRTPHIRKSCHWNYLVCKDDTAKALGLL
jgi:FkbM family methyltransferase